MVDNLRNGVSEKTGSFLSNNIGGIIITIILLMMGEISILAQENVDGSKFLGFILGIFIAMPLIFFGCFFGNKLRLMLHPDFVIADGFMGLLKEKIFWRFVPQLIGALIGYGIGFAIVGSIAGINMG